MRRDELNGEIQRLPGPAYSERFRDVQRGPRHKADKVSEFSEGSPDTVGSHASRATYQRLADSALNVRRDKQKVAH